MKLLERWNIDIEGLAHAFVIAPLILLLVACLFSAAAAVYVWIDPHP